MMGNAPSALIVEDHILIAQFLCRQLQKSGLAATHHTSAREAERFLQTSRCHVSFLDLNLPDADGAGLLKTWRRHYPSMPVIIVTADLPSETRHFCKNEGAAGILNKPFTTEQLISTLHQALPKEFWHYDTKHQCALSPRRGG